MKRGFFSIVLTLVLIAAIIIVPMLTVREKDEVVTDKTIKSLSATLLENKSSEINKTAFLPTDKVTFIIELTTESLLDDFNSQEQTNNIEEYVLSNDGIDQLQEILRQQTLVRAEIKRTVTEADFTYTKSYKTVMNGFSVQAYYASLETLQSVSGVKAVYISFNETTPQTVEESVTEESSQQNENENTENDSPSDSDTEDTPKGEPQPVDPKTLLNYSYQNMIGANKNDTYTGTGIKVAVLDTAFDTEHEVFFGETAETSQLQSYLDNGCLSVSSETKAADLYYNSKVIFGYDYAEKDTDLSSDSVHGTAVAGLIAGDNLKFTESSDYFGIAKSAELMLFKVANENLVITDDVLLAAMDDAAVLGADIINLSLNAPRLDSGSTVFTERLFQRLYQAGIFVSVAAGNSESDTLIKTNRVDYGNTGLYAISPYTFVSASVGNEVSYRYALMANEQEKIVPYMAENTEGKSYTSLFVSLSGTYTYWTIDENKDIFDFGYKELYGKIIVLNFSAVTEEQLYTLYSYGAAAVLIVSDETPVFSDLWLPVASVGSSCANYFSEMPRGTIDVNTQNIVTVKNDNAQTADALYGTTDRLTMGIDAAAPGGEIYVPVNDNKYFVLDGTSMAAAEVSGAAAVLKSYMEQNETFADWSRQEKNEWVYAQLISTAEPVVSGDGTYISPRIAGSGLIQIQKALDNKTFITVAGTRRPKSEHGACNDNLYAFLIRIYNTSDTDVSYRFEKILQTDAAVEIDSVQYKSNEMISILDKANFSVKQGPYLPVSSVTVPASGWVDVSVRIVLDEDFIDEQKKVFEQGFFIDGYLRLIALDENGINLTVPFMSFCGDWSETSILEENQAAVLYNITYDENSHGYIPTRIGFNELTGERTDNMVYSGTSYTNYLKAVKRISDHTFSMSILVPSVLTARTTEQMTLSISDTNGNTVYTDNFNIFRTDVLSAAGVIYQKNNFPQLKEGKYTYTITADSSLKSEDTVLTFPITVDKTVPQAVKSEVYAENGRIYLTLTAKDNTAVQGFLMYAAVYDAKNDKYNYADCLQTLIQEKIISEDAIRLVKQSKDGEGVFSFTYDITQLKAALTELSSYYREKCGIACDTTKIVWAATDYAWNISEPQTADSEPNGSLLLHFVDTDGNAVSGVKVQVADNEEISDENGKIYIQNLSLATYAVHIISSPIGDLRNAVFELTISPSEIAFCREVTLKDDSFALSVYQAESSGESGNGEKDTSAAVVEEESRTSSFIFAWILIAVLLVISILALLFSRRRRLGK
ncbi:MAG: S8 family serine peptidase [Acutalibacteraceae bacterium]